MDGQQASQAGGPNGSTVAAALQRQVLFRAVNEQIEQLGRRWNVLDEPFAVLCECGDPTCAERIELTKTAYEDVRRRPERFVLKPGHEVPGADKIVGRAGGYLVTEKSGRDAEAAARLDPRLPAAPVSP